MCILPSLKEHAFDSMLQIAHVSREGLGVEVAHEVGFDSGDLRIDVGVLCGEGDDQIRDICGALTQGEQ